MNNKRMLIVAGILIAIIIVCALILANVYVEESRKIPEEQRAKIEVSGWPMEEVPVLIRENMEMIKFGDELAIERIDSGVKFTDFKSYLHELADAGFEADSFYGCKHPDMISSNFNDETATEFTWIAESKDYKVIAIWKKEGTDKRINNVYIELYDAVGPEYFEGRDWTYATPEHEQRVEGN
ncbi:MAG: hypothetical protein IKJ32_06870 [Clostridia bacterium]|nr:hypothetical protein [Clostridia bacterium]